MPGPEKRSVSLQGHRTSVTLEPEFWAELEAIAAHDKTSLAALIARIDAARVETGAGQNLSSAARVFVLNSLRTAGKSQ